MDGDFVSNQPIYLQIMTRIKQMIARGVWPPGERVASVRDLAVQFGVNPNTVQRALGELEREELLFTERTAGRFVTKDHERISHLRAETARACLDEFFMQMNEWGYTRAQIIEMIEGEVSHG